MNRFFLRHLINHAAPGTPITLTYAQAVDCLDVMDLSEDHFHELQWIRNEADFLVCPDCTHREPEGHAEDCGLAWVLEQLTEQPSAPRWEVPS